MTGRLNDLTGMKKWLANKGLKSKKEKYKKTGHTDHWFWDKLVYKKFSAALGGNIKMLVTAAAPIGPDVFEFISLATSAPFF